MDDGSPEIDAALASKTNPSGEDIPNPSTKLVSTGEHVRIHYNGQWREEPVFDAGWHPYDYIYGKRVVLEGLLIEQLSVDFLRKGIQRLEKSLRGHVMSFIGLVAGSRKLLQNAEEFREWWFGGTREGEMRQLYMNHVVPVRHSRSDPRGKKKSSQPEPILTPVQPTQEIPIVMGCTPTQTQPNSPKTPKTKRRVTSGTVETRRSPRLAGVKKKLYTEEEPTYYLEIEEEDSED